MSNVCCQEFSGWCKSFTKIERALAVLQAVLLVVLIVLLVLFILHLIVCSKSDDRVDGTPHTTPTDYGQHDGKTTHNDDTSTHGFPTKPHDPHTPEHETAQTGEPGTQCSWTPSAKTTAAHYYEHGATHTDDALVTETEFPKINVSTNIAIDESTLAGIVEQEPVPTATQVFDYSHESVLWGRSDGKDAEEQLRSLVLALVKLKPPKDVIFGCILTIVAEYWTLTAASCIEAIEEIDSLDSFVIMEQYGSNERGPLHTVEDVQIHPLYEGKNESYDLAALKSSGSLTRGAGLAVELASTLDLALTTIGESFTVLGYGAFRSIDKSPTGRSLRQAAVHLLPARQCAGGGGAARAACGARALCAGAVWARGLPCNYCSGTPLLTRGAALLGVMSDNSACGVACEPQLYASVPDAADWIEATLRRE